MSKHVAQSETLVISPIKNAVVIRMLLITFIHVTDSERKIPLNIRKSVTRNTQITGAVVTFDLLNIQQLK
jgi:hypothetical protein